MLLPGKQAYYVSDDSSCNEGEGLAFYSTNKREEGCQELR
jgi:hypothetical protein